MRSVCYLCLLCSFFLIVFFCLCFFFVFFFYCFLFFFVCVYFVFFFFFFSSRRRHTRCLSDWSSDVCSSDLAVFCGDRIGTHMRDDSLTAASAAQRDRTSLECADVAWFVDGRRAHAAV